MAKDKKAKAADKKARVAAKTEKKSKQKEKKASKKPKSSADGADSDAENVDLDAVLAEYAKAQEQYLKVTETVTDPPSARGSATLLASPSNDRELLLFGGEYFDGTLARFYNDLYIYNTHRDEWRRVTSPNSPLHRSGHAWTRGGNLGGVWLFGGEFSSPKQGTFYHYGDFWRLDPASREWSKIEAKGKNSAPPARSGHRMTFFKQYIVLFAGFQDTSSQTKYLNDLWLYDTSSFAWHQPALPPASPRPEPRSSFTFLPHEQGAVLAGGYSRVKTTTVTKQTRGGGGGAQQNVLKPLVHTDSWFLRITPPPSEAPQNTPPAVRWERRKKPANLPSPARAGATMAPHKGRGIMFGGVHDVEESEEGIDSEFFNQLFVWNVDRNRYFSLGLRRPRAQKAKKAGPDAGERGAGRRNRAKADEMELLARLKALEARDTVQASNDTASSLDGTTAVGSDSDSSDDEDADNAREKTVLWEMPHPRFNATLAVQHDVLYVYGGTFEKGDREYTFDEMYAIDLGKLDGVKEIFRRELADWGGVESSDDEDDDDDDEEDEDEDGETEGGKHDEENALSTGAPDDALTTADSKSSKPIETAVDQDDELDENDEAPGSTDSTPHPRPFESLRAFYARTSTTWQENVLADLAASGGLAAGAASGTVKSVRKGGFALAEARWWAVREEIRTLEDAQEEAGIGEVVSLEERKAAGASTGAGRRR